MNRLKDLRLFQQVDKNTIDAVWESGKVTIYQKGDHCFSAREVCNKVYILLSGKVAIYNLTHSGKRKIIFYLGHGALLNDQVTKTSLPAVSCQTIDKCEVFCISKDRFLKLMEKDFSLTQAIFSDYEQKLFRMSHQLKNTLGCIYLERKLASKLWKLARDFGVQVDKGIYIDIPFSITELADFLGAPRESTSRALKKLVEKGLVWMDGKRIYVIDPERMSVFYRTGKTM